MTLKVTEKRNAIVGKCWKKKKKNETYMKKLRKARFKCQLKLSC